MAEPTRILLVSALPEGYPHLEKVSVELEKLKGETFEGYNRQITDYRVEICEYINIDKFYGIVRDFQPDIIHFTGHGSKDGLIFQHGDKIPPEKLDALFGNKNKVQLLFLNACYSADQFDTLSRFSNITFIIGNEDEISEDAATDFAILFYENYKNYKKEEDIPKAFLDAVNAYNFQYQSEGEHNKQHFSKPELVEKLQHSKTPIQKEIEKYGVEVIQSEEIPSDLRYKIQNIIKSFDEDNISQDPLEYKFQNAAKAFDENMIISHDQAKFLKFKDEMKNISDIISTLRIHTQEYGITVKPEELSNKNQQVVDLINSLDGDLLPGEKVKKIQSFQNIYEDIINNVFKKIFYNFFIDSIEKLRPLLPEDPDDEFFGDIIGIMNGILKSLNFLREKVNQSFEPNHKFYEDYMIKRCFNLIKYIELDFNDLIELLRCEMKEDVIKIDKKISDQLAKIKNLNKHLEGVQSQKDRGSRITDLKECLENVSNIEQGLNTLFRTIILYGLEQKRKNSQTNYVPSLLNVHKSLVTKHNTKKSFKEIKALEDELMENVKMVEPKKLLSIISELTMKLVKEYENYSYNENYSYDDIHSCYENINRALETVRNKISENLENNLEKFDKYPYLYPEISVLSNFCKFRLSALERKQGREYLIAINYYFSKLMYSKVSEFTEIKGTHNNINLLNAKLLNKIGVANLYLEDYDQAKKIFHKILEINNSDKSNSKSRNDALFNLGLAYQELERKFPEKKFRKSIEQFEKILKNDPYHVNTLTSLGALYFKIEKYDEAYEKISTVLDHDYTEQNNWRALLAMGCILSDGKKQYSDARRYFDACESLNPNSISIKLNKSQNLILDKGFKDAKKILKEIQENMADIEDRSTKIIIIILLICLSYLNQEGANIEIKSQEEANTEREGLFKDLLRLFDLKDPKLVDWNFQNLKNTISEDNLITSNDKDLLKTILSVTGTNLENISESTNEKIKKIQTFVMKNRDDHHDANLTYISDDKLINLHAIKLPETIGKSEWNEKEWFIWNISLELSPEFLDKNVVDYVLYRFDPRFRDTRENKNLTAEDGKNLKAEDGKSEFSIYVIGWEETKFELELHCKDHSIFRKVEMLKC